MSTASQPAGLFTLKTIPGYVPLEVQGVPQAAHANTGPPRRQLAAKSPGVTPPPLSAEQPANDAAWVATDDDVAAYFERHGSNAQVQCFYCLDDGSGQATEVASGAATDLRVVTQDEVMHAHHFYIISQRLVVKVDKRTGEHTETTSLAERMAHKRAFLRLRELTFFGSFALAKCFGRWHRASRAQVLRRRAHELQQSLFLARPAFQGPLLEATGLLAQLRAVRAVGVQPGRLYSAADWAEQQGTWWSRKAQPELEAAAQQLARVAEGVCTQVESAAQHVLESTRALELQDRIGVDLYAATAKAKARSMQQIKHDKLAKARAYHQALAERRQLPRFLRMLDFRAANALADMAVASVADAAGVLRAAAPGMPDIGRRGRGGAGLDGVAGGSSVSANEHSEDGEPDGVEQEAGLPDSRHRTASHRVSSPAFLCNLVFAEDGSSIVFSPSEAEWTAALEGEAVRSSLRLAGSVPAMLTLPAFERYRAQLLVPPAGQPCPEGGKPVCPAGHSEAGSQWLSTSEEPQQQRSGMLCLEANERQQEPADQPEHGIWAAELAQQDTAFLEAASSIQAMLRGSFLEARRLVQQYQQCQVIRWFGQGFDFGTWAAQQRASLHLEGIESTLRQLQQWQEQLEQMPLACTAGLLRLDAAGLQASLRPVVASAQENIAVLLLQLAGEKCRQHLNDLVVWLEVAAARPAELDGFLSWAAEVAHMQQEAGGQLAAAAEADAALELVVTFAGRLPTAEAVKRDDLKEAVAKLAAELAMAAAWGAEQRAAHAVAVEEQVQVVIEEAVILEGELKLGQYVDVDASSGEVLADLELQQSRLAQLAAQAEELMQLQEELGASPGSFLEIKDAEAALEGCTKLWVLVSEAELLQASLADAGDQHAAATDAANQLAVLQGRLAAARGSGTLPSTVWLRANGAVLVCKDALAA